MKQEKSLNNQCLHFKTRINQQIESNSQSNALSEDTGNDAREYKDNLNNLEKSICYFKTYAVCNVCGIRGKKKN